jgi:hypothetical protein
VMIMQNERWSADVEKKALGTIQLMIIPTI